MHSGSLFHIIEGECNLPKIVTMSQNIDSCISGGVPLCGITEICGSSGSGKTQITLQLAVDVQMPKCVGGVNGEALFIDTDGSFFIERFLDIATGTIAHCHRLNNAAQDFSLKHILSHLHYKTCRDRNELMSILHLLPSFLTRHNNIRLIVIDSITSPFRQDANNLLLRTRLLANVAQILLQIAITRKIAVVLTNQLTTRVVDGCTAYVPALGECWGHSSTIRILINKRNSRRCATILKSPTDPKASALFQVTTAGIRDVLPQSTSECSKQLDDSNLEPCLKKIKH